MLSLNASSRSDGSKSPVRSLSPHELGDTLSCQKFPRTCSSLSNGLGEIISTSESQSTKLRSLADIYYFPAVKEVNNA